MLYWRRATLCFLPLLIALAGNALAGGGPRNVMVLFNEADPEAYETAQYYLKARAIAPNQLCAIKGVEPEQVEIELSSFSLLFQERIADCLATLNDASRIDYLVVIRGLPYRVKIPAGYTTSLSAMLQVSGTTRIADNAPLVGQAQLKTQSGVYSPSVENPLYQKHWGSAGGFELKNPTASMYTASLRIANATSQPPSFHRLDAPDANGYRFSNQLFIVTRLDGFDHGDARALVDRALLAEELKPDAAITCMAAADEARGARDPECHYVSGLLSAAGISSQFILEHDAGLTGQPLSSYLTGAANLKGAIDGNTYQPGAYVDNLTSFGAAPENFFCSADASACPQNENQTSIARFVRAGATIVHGTANEPLNLCFPNAGMLLLYTMGYNVAESVFFNQRFLYWQNILIGDPLTSPWARRPTVTVLPDNSDDRPSSATVSAEHPDGVIHLAVYLNNQFVGQTTGSPLVIEIPAMGNVELLAVATARNVSVSRAGWPQPKQVPQADVQGWTQLLIEKAEESVEAPTVVEGDSPQAVEVENEKQGSGGCHQGRPPAGQGALFLCLLLGLILIRVSGRARRC